MRLTLALLTTLLLAPLATLHAADSRDWKVTSKPEIPQEMRVERDVTYLAADRREKVDVYFLLSQKFGQRVSAVLLKANKPLTLRYRVIAQDGAFDTKRMSELASDFAEPKAK